MNLIQRLIEIIRSTLGIIRTEREIEPPYRISGKSGTAWVVRDHLVLESLAGQSREKMGKDFRYYSCDFLRSWVAIENADLTHNKWIFIGCWRLGYKQKLRETPYRYRSGATHAIVAYRGGFWDEMNHASPGRVYLWQSEFSILLELKSLYAEQDGGLVAKVESLSRQLVHTHLFEYFKGWKEKLYGVAIVRDDL